MKRRYHLKHAFSNLLVSYFIMLILPVLFIIILYQQAYSMAVKNCVENSQVTLQQLNTQVGERIKALDNIAMQNIIYDMDINSILTSPKARFGDPYIYNIVLTSKKLDFMFDGNLNYYSRYQLLSKTSDTVYYSGAVAYGLELYFNRFYLEPQFTYDEWYTKIFFSDKRILLPSAKVTLSNYPVQAIIYNYPINQVGKKNTPIGVLQFVIPENYLLTIPKDEQENASFYLMDENDITICSTENAIPFPKDRVGNRMSRTGYIKTNLDNHEKIIVYNKSDETSMIVAAIYDEQIVLDSAKNIRFTALLSLSILFIVEILLIIWISYKNAIPIHNFANNLKLLLYDDLQKDKAIPISKSEYEYLEHGIHKLQQNQNTLNIMTEEKINLQKKVFLDQLIEGRFKDAQEIFLTANSIGIELNAQEYYVAAIRYEGNMDVIFNTLQSLLQEERSYYLILHNFEPNIIIAIFEFYLYDIFANENLLATKMKNFIFQLKKQGISINVGIGKSYFSPADLVLSYQQAKYCLKFADGSVPVVYEKFVEKNHSAYYPQELENRLFNATKYRESEKITIIFDVLRKENFIKRNLSHLMYSILISNIEYTLFNLYHDLLLEERIDDIVRKISQTRRQEENMSTLEEEFLFLAGRQEEMRSSRNQLLCDSIQEFLHANFTDSELCLTSIAEKFDFSDSYFSQFYKDSFNETFSTALENIRLNVAKKLILESNLDIEQIAKRVGYNNSTTFRRAFKRVYGKAPSAYKIEAMYACQQDL